jgi:hypothetical protein
MKETQQMGVFQHPAKDTRKASCMSRNNSRGQPSYIAIIPPWANRTLNTLEPLFVHHLFRRNSFEEIPKAGIPIDKRPDPHCILIKDLTLTAFLTLVARCL